MQVTARNYQYRTTNIKAVLADEVLQVMRHGKISDLPHWVQTIIGEGMLIQTRFVLVFCGESIPFESGFRLVLNERIKGIRAMSENDFVKEFELVPSNIEIDISSEIFSGDGTTSISGDVDCSKLVIETESITQPKIYGDGGINQRIQETLDKPSSDKSCPGICPTCENLAAVLRGMDIFPSV